MTSIEICDGIKNAVGRINDQVKQINDLVSDLAKASDDAILLSFVLSDANAAAEEAERTRASMEHALKQISK